MSKEKPGIEKVIPMFTLEMRLRAMPPGKRKQIINNSESLFGCSRRVLGLIRYTPAQTPEQEARGEKCYSPYFNTIKKIADYMGLPIDALVNRTREKIIKGEQLEVLPAENNKVLQLEINSSIADRYSNNSKPPQKKKATG